MQQSRPKIICHMMSTIEGKITSGESVDILDDYFPLYTKIEDMLSVKAWMCGRVTMQMFTTVKSTPLPQRTSSIDDQDFLTPFSGSHFMFGVDTKGLLRWDKNTIKLSNIEKPLHLVIIVTKSTPKEYLAHLREQHISYLVAGDNEINFQQLFISIKEKFHIDTLLLEGGGLLNGSVMAGDFVDEISLLLTPIVVNRTKAPSLFERKVEEPIDITKYKLTYVEKMEKDVVWLRYKKV